MSGMCTVASRPFESVGSFMMIGPLWVPLGGSWAIEWIAHIPIGMPSKLPSGIKSVSNVLKLHFNLNRTSRFLIYGRRGQIYDFAQKQNENGLKNEKRFHSRQQQQQHKQVKRHISRATGKKSASLRPFGRLIQMEFQFFKFVKFKTAKTWKNRNSK